MRALKGVGITFVSSSHCQGRDNPKKSLLSEGRNQTLLKRARLWLIKWQRSSRGATLSKLLEIPLLRVPGKLFLGRCLSGGILVWTAQKGYQGQPLGTGASAAVYYRSWLLESGVGEAVYTAGVDTEKAASTSGAGKTTHVAGAGEAAHTAGVCLRDALDRVFPLLLAVSLQRPLLVMFNMVPDDKRN